MEKPASACPLENGNWLITSHDNINDNEAVEVDKQGKIVWRVKAKNVFFTHAIRLENGNTLVLDYGSNNLVPVAEIDASGKRVWEYNDRQTIASVQQMRNGNVLICANHEILEVNKETNKVVSRLQWSSQLEDAFRLENGDTFIMEHGRVFRLNQDGEEIWSKKITHGSVRR